MRESKFKAKKTVVNGITFDSKPFKVVVQRYHKDNYSELYNGFFISEVYAIKENQFLVYDDGDYSADLEPFGFMWVDFTEYIPDLENQDKQILKVTLYEENDGKSM